jgi:hypothetical protein
MAKIDDVYNNSKAFSRGNNEGRDMLFEQLDHFVNEELSYRIQDGDENNIHLDLFVVLDVLNHWHEPEGSDAID